MWLGFAKTCLLQLELLLFLWLLSNDAAEKRKTKNPLVLLFQAMVIGFFANNRFQQEERSETVRHHFLGGMVVKVEVDNAHQPKCDCVNPITNDNRISSQNWRRNQGQYHQHVGLARSCGPSSSRLIAFLHCAPLLSWLMIERLGEIGPH